MNLWYTIAHFIQMNTHGQISFKGWNLKKTCGLCYETFRFFNFFDSLGNFPQKLTKYSKNRLRYGSVWAFQYGSFSLRQFSLSVSVSEFFRLEIFSLKFFRLSISVSEFFSLEIFSLRFFSLSFSVPKFFSLEFFSLKFFSLRHFSQDD